MVLGGYLSILLSYQISFCFKVTTLGEFPFQAAWMAPSSEGEMHQSRGARDCPPVRLWVQDRIFVYI